MDIPPPNPGSDTQASHHGDRRRNVSLLGQITAEGARKRAPRISPGRCFLLTKGGHFTRLSVAYIPLTIADSR